MKPKHTSIQGGDSDDDDDEAVDSTKQLRVRVLHQAQEGCTRRITRSSYTRFVRATPAPESEYVRHLVGGEAYVSIYKEYGAAI